ncbi:Putative amino-acid permease C15C4.04c [Fusarium odoratissimum]|uniref:Putative amino-acid permease C15C4.04c n=1 Tax=Fusarium oxysporum f. sp. cubense (strain race 4) TaxID=2502994 RepID=N1RPX0_FUSC4|nr:Putative amino-acid permease C15C4.04c [Fusarium odoratissimum]
MSRASSSTASNDDALELEAAGYAQAMPRRFSLWSLGALSFTLTCTWLGTGSSIGISLTEASSAGTLWSLPIAGVMTTIVSLGMAELASAYPVAGAQYYWSFMVARDDYKPFASYLNGWMSVIGWWLASSSVSNFVSSMILDIVGAWHPDWDQKRWHQYLIYVALIWIATAANIFTAQWIPLFNKMVFILSVLTLSATTITLFVVTKDRASAEFIFTDTTNRTGWSTTTSSRTLWAVSRDGALPYSQFWGRVHSRFQVPVNALLLSAVFITLYGLIFLGSSTAFSAMVSAAIIFLQTSCVIPQAVLLYRGRDRVLPLRYFSLGRYGAAINGISVAWVVFLDILYCFPTTMPVTPENMSYVSVVFTGLVAFVIALWFTTKKGTFTGPQINIDLLNARRMAAVQTLEGTRPTAEYHALRSSETVKED